MPPTEVTADEAAAMLRPDDTVGFPLGPGQPVDLIHAMGTRTDWSGLDVLCGMLVDFYELPTRPGVRTLSMFFGPAERAYRDSDAHIEFIPADFRRWTQLYEVRRPRVMGTVVAPPDADGWCSLAAHAGATVRELHRCGAEPDRVLIVEINDTFPTTFGDDANPHRLHLDEAGVVYRSSRPPVVLTDPEVTDIERSIAAHAQTYVRDGATLQTGFGSIPSTIATALAHGDGGDYGIHSEMFTTGLMRLHQAGKVTNARKTLFEGRSVSTFAAGIPELYEWLDQNHDVLFLPVDVVNDERIIAANHELVAINGAISVDLSGQIVADSITGLQWSGIGGHEDFIAGAGQQLEDRSLVCLPSSTIVDGARVSRIVDRLLPGSIVTTPRHHTDVVITEHGVAELRGRTVHERAVALAGIAHPDSRDTLLAAAEQMR